MRKIAKYLKLKFQKNLTSLLLKDVKPVDIKDSEYVFIFSPVRIRFYEKLYALISHRLSKIGIASCFPFKNDWSNSAYPGFDVDGLAMNHALIIGKTKRIIKSAHGNELFFEWIVDIENEKIEAQGINFFPVIRSTLRSLQKRYNVFFHDQDNHPVYTDLIQSCDALLKYFLLLKDYSQKTDKKIRLVGYEIDYIPNGVFKTLCDQLSSNHDIEFIELRQGYMHYFGQHHHRDSFITCSNLTKTQRSEGWSISKNELSQMNGKSIDRDELLKPIASVLNKNIYSEISEDQKQVINIIKDYQSRGEKIFVLFAHLFYDTPVKDESSAFKDMCAWVSETVNFFSAENNLLLIKPHPAEFVKGEPKKIPNETLKSFLGDISLSKNVILLEPHLFSIKDLSPFLSYGLVWRSSVAMELAFLGIPCIIAGNPYYSALDLIFAKDKKHYIDLIKQSHDLKITDQQKINVAKYLYLLKKKHTHLDSILYNQKLRSHYWKRKALKKYLEKGDDNINSIVENMLV